MCMFMLTMPGTNFTQDMMCCAGVGLSAASNKGAGQRLGVKQGQVYDLHHMHSMLAFSVHLVLLIQAAS